MGMLLWLACGSGGDACGGQGSDVVICRYNSPPEVVILAPADGAQTGAEVAAEAVVADDQSEPPELLLRWSSDVDGALEESTADAEGRVAAALILIEIGDDMARFGRAQSLACWAALSPGNNESAGKRKSGRTGHGNSGIRFILCECANAARMTFSAP